MSGARGEDEGTEGDRLGYPIGDSAPKAHIKGVTRFEKNSFSRNGPHLNRFAAAAV